jgi:predicted Fe-Mo cluster-binding NifX family protein
VAISFVNSAKVVKLTNHGNSIHKELRPASQNPERRKWQVAQMLQNGQIHGEVCTEACKEAFWRITASVCYLLAIFSSS